MYCGSGNNAGIDCCGGQILIRVILGEEDRRLKMEEGLGVEGKKEKCAGEGLVGR